MITVPSGRELGGFLRLAQCKSLGPLRTWAARRLGCGKKLFGYNEPSTGGHERLADVGGFTDLGGMGAIFHETGEKILSWSCHGLESRNRLRIDGYGDLLSYMYR